MTDPLRIGGLLLFPSDDSANDPRAGGTTDKRLVWTCLPASPSLALTPSGAPSLVVIDAGGVAVISLTVRLDVSDSALADAVARLAYEATVSTSLVEVRPVAVREAVARLVLTDGDTLELDRSTTSGAWPYQAALHSSLSVQQVESVKAALNGRRDTLLVQYELSFSTTRGPATRSTIESSTSRSSTTTTKTERKDGKTLTYTASEDGAAAAATFAVPRLRRIIIETDAADWLGDTSHSFITTATPSHP